MKLNFNKKQNGLIGTRLRLLAVELLSIVEPLCPSQCLSGTILVTLYLMVWDWRVLRAEPNRVERGERWKVCWAIKDWNKVEKVSIWRSNCTNGVVQSRAMSQSNTHPVRNRAPLTVRSSSLRCLSAAEHHTAEQYYKTSRWPQTLSGCIGKVVTSHAAVARSNPAEDALIYTMHEALMQGVMPIRVEGVTSQLDQPSLTSSSVTGCGWLQLEVPHWAASVHYRK